MEWTKRLRVALTRSRQEVPSSPTTFANTLLAYHDRQILAREIMSLRRALAPLIHAANLRYEENKIPDSDLDDEQPVHVSLTLGDLRKARRMDYE